MQIEPQMFLRLAEAAKSICFFDIEATGLRGDYNSTLCVSVRPYGGEAVTFSVRRPGEDDKVVAAAKAELEKYDAWTSYYGKGFDIPMLNTRLLRWGIPPIAKRHHIDLYFTLKANLLCARRSQAHLLEWSDQPEIAQFIAGHTVNEGTREKIKPALTATEHARKMTVSAEIWNKVLARPRVYMPTMIERCESDTLGLMALYQRTKHLIRDIKL